jgi:hypothetical protein
MRLGNFTLDQSIDIYTDLIELSPLEYEILQRAYPGERTFKAPATTTNGRTWAIVVSTLPSGKICKIGAQFVSGQDDLVHEAFSETYAFYEKLFALPPFVTEFGSYRWNQPFGNLILNKNGVPGFRCVNCIATSDARPDVASPPERGSSDGTISMNVPAPIKYP